MPTDSTIVNALRAIVGAEDPDLSGKLRVLCDVTRTLVAGGTDTFRAASGEYATLPGDSPANTDYWARLQVPSFTQSIFDTDWRTSGSAEISIIEFINIDGELDAEFDPAVYRWKGSTLILDGGLEGWARSDFKPLPAGQRRVVDVLKGEDIVRLLTVPEETRLDQPVQQNLYPGFGEAYDFAGTASGNQGNVCNIGMRNATVLQRFKTSVSGSAMTLFDKRGSTGTGTTPIGIICLQRASDDKIRMRCAEGNSHLTLLTDATYNDGLWHEIAYVFNRAGSLTSVFVDGVSAATAEDNSAQTDSFSNALNFYHGSQSGSTNKYDGELDEPEVYYRALTADELLNRSKFSTDGTELGLISCVPYDEGTGTTADNLVKGPMQVQPALDGTMDCDMGNNADVALGSATLTGWARTVDGDTGFIAGKRNNATSLGYSVEIRAGDFVFEIDDGVAQFTVTIAGTAAVPFDDDTPWGWALVIDRTLKELRGYVLDYQRGTLTAGTPTNITACGTITNGQNFTLGEFDDGTAPYTGAPSWIFFTPSILDAAGLLVALSEQAVNLDDDAPSAPPALTPPVASSHFWPLNENTGTTATDQIGSADGTWSAEPTWTDRHVVITTGLGSAWVDTETGGKDVRGLPIPIPLGRPQRFTPVWISRGRLKLQFGDPLYGASEEVEKVWRGAELLTVTTDYTVDLTGSIVALVAEPDEPITMTVKGVKNSGGTWLRYPGELIEFLWEDVLGLSNVESASITAYDLAHPYQQELWLGPCDQTLQCAYDRLLSPDGVAIRTLDNEMALRTRVAPGVASAALTLEAADIASVESLQSIPPPTWLVRISYDRTIQKLSAWNSSASLDDKVDHSQSVRYVEDRRVEVLDGNPEALIRTYDTGSGRRADAALLVQRMLDLDGHEQSGWVLELTKDHWAVDVVEEILVSSYSRYDLAGKQYVVIATDYGIRDGLPTTKLTVWRPET